MRPVPKGRRLKANIVLWWLRRDLRLHDNLALHAALATGAKVLPVFVLDPSLLCSERMGLPRLKFMLAGLAALGESLRELGGELLIQQGEPRTVLSQVVRSFGAAAVYANRDYTPFAVQRDRSVANALDVPLHLFDDAMVHPPGQTLKADGSPFVVYSPYKRQWLVLPKPEVVSYSIREGQLHHLPGIERQPMPSLADLGFGSTINVPVAGEAEAARRLARFTGGAVFDYSVQRDILAVDPFADGGEGATSGLSPYFRFGMLSPRQAYHAAQSARSAAASASQRESVDAWMSELAWRDFYMHILFHFPRVHNSSFRPEYEQVDFREAPEELKAWQEGRTGFPVVDAAMRQLNSIGWMHNRARMIVASFLTKDLLISWREGEAFFMKQLIDGDPAANNGGWQWSAGTGTDAQPYFRIFNPVSQSKKFDPQGSYIRRWLPELQAVPDSFIHEPWTMESPPKDYPPRIVDHPMARERALAAFRAVKKGTPADRARPSRSS